MRTIIHSLRDDRRLYQGSVILTVSFAISALFLNSPLLFAQDEGSTASLPRPKVKEHGHLQLKNKKGEPIGGYEIAYYLQEGKTFRDQDAHVFYEPLLYLETEEGKLKKTIREDMLVLYIHRHDPSEDIEEALRDELKEKAKQEAVEIEKGTKPYRIQALPFSVAELESRLNRPTKPILSDKLYTTFTERGSIPIYFRIDAMRAEAFVKNLEAGIDTLLFKYQFAGVADTRCTAVAERSEIQEIDLFKKVVGDGREGFVSRDQAASIADEIRQSLTLTTRCADLTTADALMDKLLAQLGEPEQIASWDELEKLTQFDQKNFSADVTKAVKDIKNTVTQEYILNALSEAESESKSKGIDVSAGAFGAKLGGGWADSLASTQANAKKDITDTLKKVGTSAEWKGEKLVPKSVDVYSNADLRSAWGDTVSIEYSLTKGQTNEKEVNITKKAWYRSLSQEDRIDFRKQLDELKESIGPNITVNSCLYRIGDSSGQAYSLDGIYSLGKSADTAILSGMSQCGRDLNNYDDSKVMLTRANTTSPWLLHVIDTDCKRREGGFVRVVFFNGMGVGKDSASEYYEGLNYKGSPSKLEPLSCSMRDQDVQEVQSATASGGYAQ